MPAKNDSVHIRINSDLKKKVVKILDQLGLSQPEALSMFYKQVVLNRGLPFEVKIPNKTTREAIKEDLAKTKGFSSTKALIDDLES